MQRFPTTILAVLLLAAASHGNANAIETDDGRDVFLLIGQSNADGQGNVKKLAAHTPIAQGCDFQRADFATV